MILQDLLGTPEKKSKTIASISDHNHLRTKPVNCRFSFQILQKERGDLPKLEVGKPYSLSVRHGSVAWYFLWWIIQFKITFECQTAYKLKRINLENCFETIIVAIYFWGSIKGQEGIRFTNTSCPREMTKVIFMSVSVESHRFLPPSYLRSKTITRVIQVRCW